MISKKWALSGLLFVVLAIVAGSALSLVPRAEAQALPPMPAVFSGSITASGSPVPDNFFITAKVGYYESDPAYIVDGRYSNLSVVPPTSSYLNRPITFHLGPATADEGATYIGLSFFPGFDLTFPFLADPTPTPTPTPDLDVSPTPTSMPTTPPRLDRPCSRASSSSPAGGSQTTRGWSPGWGRTSRCRPSSTETSTSRCSTQMTPHYWERRSSSSSTT